MTSLDHAFIKAYTQHGAASAALPAGNGDVVSLADALKERAASQPNRNQSAEGLLNAVQPVPPQVAPTVTDPAKAPETPALETPALETPALVTPGECETPEASEGSSVPDTIQLPAAQKVPVEQEMSDERQECEEPGASDDTASDGQEPEAGVSLSQASEIREAISMDERVRSLALALGDAEPTAKGNETVGVKTVGVKTVGVKTVGVKTVDVKTVDVKTVADADTVDELPTFLRIEPSHAKARKPIEPQTESPTPRLDELDLGNLVSDGVIRRVDPTPQPTALPAKAQQTTEQAPVDVQAVPRPHIEPPQMAARPEATQPEATEPQVSLEPPTSEPNTHVDNHAERVVTPEVTEPKVTEPKVTEPKVTEPKVAEKIPTVTDPRLADEVPAPEVAEKIPTVTDPRLADVNDETDADAAVAEEKVAEADESESPAEPFRPMLQVDQFAWPRLAKRLGSQDSGLVGDLADALLKAADAGRKTLAIGGCWRGDGVTTLLLSAAKQLIARGLHIALVEGNLADPNLDRSLEVLPEFGWEDVLAGRLPLEEVVIESIGDGSVALLPVQTPLAGSIDDEADVIAENLDTLRDAYDLVLVDLGPLEGRLTVEPSSTRTLVKMMDTVVLVHNCKEISKSRLARTGRHLRETGVAVEGVVENFVGA